MTFDRKKESKLLESLEDEDLLLDFHDMSDFSNKINFFLKRKCKGKNVPLHFSNKLSAFMS